MKIWRPWVEHINDGSPEVHIWRLHLVDWPFRFYLHHIVRADHDRFLHNHPRPFISLVLTGGYTEQTCDDMDAAGRYRNLGRGGARFNVMTTKRYHKIVYVEPGTWTLLLGRYRKDPADWGFLTPDRSIIPYEQWVNHPKRAYGEVGSY